MASTHPFGLAVADLPPPYRNVADAILPQADRFAPRGPGPGPDAPAILTATGSLTVGEVLAVVGSAAAALAEGAVLLSAAAPDLPHGGAAAPWPRGRPGSASSSSTRTRPIPTGSPRTSGPPQPSASPSADCRGSAEPAAAGQARTLRAEAIEHRFWPYPRTRKDRTGRSGRGQLGSSTRLPTRRTVPSDRAGRFHRAAAVGVHPGAGSRRRSRRQTPTRPTSNAPSAGFASPGTRGPGNRPWMVYPNRRPIWSTAAPRCTPFSGMAPSQPPHGGPVLAGAVSPARADREPGRRGSPATPAAATTG